MAVAAKAQAQFFVSGSPAQMTVSAAAAGSAPTAVTNATTTYFQLSTPSSGHFAITASINTAMPAGVTLKVALAASKGTSLGAVALTTTAQNVVTTITGSMLSQSITYTLSATAAAGVVAVQSKTVTFTLISTP
jgi:predicted aspartyl protease